MKRKKKKKSPFKKIQREQAKQSGFYDGRFRSRTVKDKKKEQSKTKARKFNLRKEAEE